MKIFAIISLLSFLGNTAAYTTQTPKYSSRKAFLQTCTASVTSAAIFQAATPTLASAFDGTGSSAYAGRTPASKAELKKSYQNWVIADIKDFKQLGADIQGGQTEGDAWVNFFIEFQRREPDSVGRTYAGLVDLVGGEDISGCGTLLAASYAKQGKAADNLPSVKKYIQVKQWLTP